MRVSGGSVRRARALAALMAGLAITASCGLPDPGIDPGLVERAADPAGFTGRTAWLQVPTGRLTFTVTDPLEVVPASDTLTGSELEPTDDTDLVGVSWSAPDLTGVPTEVKPLVVEASAEPNVVVMAGDERIDVTDQQQAGSGSIYLGVPRGEPMAFEVEFDGVTQSVALDSGEQTVPAQAQPLYDEATSATEVTCDEQRFEPRALRPEMSCGVETFPAPYVAGAGWAPEHEPWQVVSVEARLDEVSSTSDPATTYTAEPTSGAGTLDAASPSITVPRENELDGHFGSYFVFAAPPETPAAFDLELAYTLSKVSGTGPDDVEGSFRSSVDVG